MPTTNPNTRNKKWNSVYKNALQLVLVGAVTGVFSGATVTLFNILAEKGEKFSRSAYASARSNPALLPLLFLALLLGAFLLSVAVQISAVSRGCGIPQAEGGTRGLIRFRWRRDGVITFAACLLSIFLGLSIGAEGPSVLIGACVGDGVASTLHRNEMIKKYQITGGACTGLAVASNAPLTGMVFAFEEAHKRFTPEVFICAFSSVVFGTLARSLIYSALGMDVHSAFHLYALRELPLSTYGYVLFAGALCGGLGVAFYKSCFQSRELFKKIRPQKKHRAAFYRLAVAVLLGGIASLVSADVMGGGHGFIERLSTSRGGATWTTALGAPTAPNPSFLASLALVFLLKFFITGVNVGSGLPCGIFIPILALGACVGGVLNGIFLKFGMERAYCDTIVMICMASFFTSIVKAPLTAIIMVCEFTGSFAPLLPVILAVSIGYIIGDISRTDGIYEELLECYVHDNNLRERAVTEVFTLPLAFGAIAEKREVRDVLWPAGARVTEIRRGEERILPGGDTLLKGGDILTIVCKTDEPEKCKDDLLHILQ